MLIEPLVQYINSKHRNKGNNRELEKTSVINFCQQKIIFTIFTDDKNRLAKSNNDYDFN